MRPWFPRMKEGSGRLARGLLALLFPRKCAGCGLVLEGEGDFCPACEKALPLVPPERREKKGPWGRCVSALYYEGMVREAVHAFKFRRQDWRIVAFARLMAQAAAEELAGEFDTVTWAPVSRGRLRERGYDQSRLLAEEMCRLWGTRPEPLLRKTAETPAQSSLKGEAARRGNVLGVYQGLPEAAGKQILLVDDVFTTGSTMAECVRALKAAGARSVVCLTLAVTREKKNGG